MTGIEYMTTVCPTTSAGKDPNREDVGDAFEDGIAEGYRMHWKPTGEQMDALNKVIHEIEMPVLLRTKLMLLEEDLKKL